MPGEGNEGLSEVMSQSGSSSRRGMASRVEGQSDQTLTRADPETPFLRTHLMEIVIALYQD